MRLLTRSPIILHLRTVYVTTIYIEIISTLATAGSLIIYKATLKRSEGDKRTLLYKDYVPFNKLWLLSS